MSDAAVVWMNGGLVSADDVRVSPFDLGLTVGLGVFETMVAYDGKVFAYELHHDRLERSAGVLGFPVPEKGVIGAAIREVMGANGYHSGRFRVRVSVSAGVNPLHGGEAKGNVIITAAVSADVSGLGPAKLVCVPFTINENAATAGVKSASYADQVLAYRHALRAGGDEALMLNTRGEVSEAAMSNIFLVKGGVVKTPPLSSGCLAGVTRGLVIGLCRDIGIPVEECSLVEQDVLDADELFLTSSLREVQRARMISTSGDLENVDGGVSEQLAAAYSGLVRKELGL